MKIEHFALNVDDPDAMAVWYVKNLGLKIAKQVTEPEMDPLLLHLAFVSADPDADRAALIDAGATFVEKVHTDDGSHLVMMRDPWGLALQLCKRGKPMLGE